MRRYSHVVRLALLARGVPLDAAEDLVQDVWMRLVRQQRAGRLRRLELPGLAIAQADWLAREARRTEARRRQIAAGPVWPSASSTVARSPAAPAIEEVMDASPDVDPAALALRHERARLVRQALASCTRREREVFEAVYGPDMRPHADVARTVGLSVQRVRQLLSNARARVRSTLAEKGLAERKSREEG